MYAALSGLSSKGEKRDKETAMFSYTAAAEYKQDISISSQAQNSQHSSEPPGYPEPRLHNLLLSRVDGDFLSSHLNDCIRINEVDGAPLL
jgi:hypothetical protein